MPSSKGQIDIAARCRYGDPLVDLSGDDNLVVAQPLNILRRGIPDYKKPDFGATSDQWDISERNQQMPFSFGKWLRTPLKTMIG